MKEEGHSWRNSEERREDERTRQREKEERLMRAAKQREQLLEKTENKKKQQKITESLEKLPENKRIMLEREMERERRLNLKEAKDEVWKRQKLG